MTAVMTLDETQLRAHLNGLAEVLRACVLDGAAVSFIEPFDFNDSLEFWRTKVLPDVAHKTRVVLAAFVDQDLAGTVQFTTDLPPNQPHRCEVAKLLVHPEYRRRGIGRRLMEALECEVRARRRTLITLDTRTDDVALPLYQSLGYNIAGTIPGFALDADRQGFHATTYMYKALKPVGRIGDTKN